jgi:hypothetical protein
MKCVIKALVELEALDDPAARKLFRGIAGRIVQAAGENVEIRSLKIVEDGTGRQIDKWEDAGS